MEKITKIDDKTLQIETTTTQTILKEDLLREKEMFQSEITHLQQRISEIDLKLKALE